MDAQRIRLYISGDTFDSTAIGLVYWFVRQIPTPTRRPVLSHTSSADTFNIHRIATYDGYMRDETPNEMGKQKRTNQDSIHEATGQHCTGCGGGGLPKLG